MTKHAAASTVNSFCGCKLAAQPRVWRPCLIGLCSPGWRRSLGESYTGPLVSRMGYSVGARIWGHMVGWTHVTLCRSASLIFILPALQVDLATNQYTVWITRLSKARLHMNRHQRLIQLPGKSLPSIRHMAPGGAAWQQVRAVSHAQLPKSEGVHTSMSYS